jgi:hypothetical protein
MQSIEKSALFTDLSAEESAYISGGRHRHHNYYYTSYYYYPSSYYPSSYYSPCSRYYGNYGSSYGYAGGSPSVVVNVLYDD